MVARGRAGYVVLAGVCALLLIGLVVLEVRHEGGVRGFVEDDLLPQLGREPKRKPISIIQPSRGLRNCRVDMVPAGAKELSFGAIDGKPGHFVALVSAGGRVKVVLECPKEGATYPRAEAYEKLPRFDRFSWTFELTSQTLPTRLRWLHRGGDEDDVTIEWHAR